MMQARAPAASIHPGLQAIPAAAAAPPSSLGTQWLRGSPGRAAAPEVSRLAGAAFLAAGLVGASSRLRRLRRRSQESEWKGAEHWSGLSGSVPQVMDNVAVSKVLPHRYPFLLVDKVLEYEPGKRAVGVKCITANEPQFTGHFPDRPIMPGVLMVEAMAQLGGIVCLQPPISDGKGEFFFAGIDGVKFRKPVVPGDVLVMEVELLKFKEKYGIAKLTGKAFVDGKLAVEVAELTFALVKPK